MSACADRSGPRLVELAFARSLGADERLALEAHLASCGVCVERYRRLQLAHRVLARGADGAGEPAPLELERIAEGLGLVAPPRPSFTESFARLASSARLALATLPSPARAVAVFVAFVAGTASAVFLLALPAGDDGLVARGGDARASIAVYTVGPSGAVAPVITGARVGAGEHLKLRASAAPGVSLGAICVGLVPKGAAPRVTCLAPPVLDGEAAATVPGSVALDVPPGPATIVVVASSAHEDPRALEALLAGGATNEVLAKRLGDHMRAIERLDVVVAPAEGR